MNHVPKPGVRCGEHRTAEGRLRSSYCTTFYIRKRGDHTVPGSVPFNLTDAFGLLHGLFGEFLLEISSRWFTDFSSYVNTINLNRQGDGVDDRSGDNRT